MSDPSEQKEKIKEQDIRTKQKSIANNHFISKQDKKDEVEVVQTIQPSAKKSSGNKLFDILKAEFKSVKDGKFILENIQNYAFIQRFFGENLDDDNMAVQLCRQMGFQEFARGEPIMKQGDESDDKLYIIAQGKVGIVIAKDTNIFKKESKNKAPTNAKSTEAQQKSQASQKGQNGQQQTKGQQQINEADQLQEQPIESIVEKFGTKVNELSLGDGFGEKALLLSPQEAKRNATIIALEKTFCITLVRKDFLRIQENFNKENILREELMISQMPFLKSITSSSTKEALILYFKNQSASRGKCLTQEGKVGEYVYILQQGKVTIEKSYLDRNNIYFEQYQTIKITEISEPSFIGEEILFIDSEVQEKINQEQKLTFQDQKLNSKISSNMINNTNIGDNTSGQDRQAECLTTENEEFIQETYKYTVKVDSLICKFFVIPKIIFLNKFPKEILKDIKEKYLKKEKARYLGFEKLKMNKQEIIVNQNGKVDSTFQMMSEISNKEVFFQMKPQLIDNRNKILLRKYENAIHINHKPEHEKFQEELSQDFRKEVEKKFEEIEKKKVLLKQKFNMTSKQRAKEINEQKLHPSSNNSLKKLQTHNLQSDQKPLQSPRSPKETKQENRRSSNESVIKASPKQFLTPPNYSNHLEDQIKKLSNLSPLQKLQLNQLLFLNTGYVQKQKNVDGSLDAVELMTKVKFKKIQIEDVSITDIMGEGFDVFSNSEANRLLTIKSTISKEKEDKIELLKEESQKKLVTSIRQKIQKGETCNLDLGYLSQFKKMQHFKLVQLGKIKVDSPTHYKVQEGESLMFNHQIKDKIIAQKSKDQENQVEKSNLITGVSYLTPSSQKTDALNNQFFPGVNDISKLDKFSDYFSTFRSSISSNSSVRSYQPSPKTRVNNLFSNNNSPNNKLNNQSAQLNFTISSNNQKTHTGLSEKQNSIGDLTAAQAQIHLQTQCKSRSIFSSEGNKPQSTICFSANYFKTNPRVLEDQSNPIKIEEEFDYEKKQEIQDFQIKDKNIQNTKIKKFNGRNISAQLHSEESQSLPNSPILTSSMYSNFILSNEQDTQNSLIKSVKNAKKSQSLMGSVLSTQSNSTVINKKQQHQSNSCFQNNYIVSSNKFVFNQYLATKNKQRQQLCLSRGSKVRQQSLLKLTSSQTSLNSNSQQLTNQNFVFNSFLK